MGDDNPYWKAQTQLMLSALLAFVLAAAALWSAAGPRGRGAAITGVCLIVGGFAMLYWAATISTWCAPATARFAAEGPGLIWSDHPWHEPTLRDCLSVRRHTATSVAQ